MLTGGGVVQLGEAVSTSQPLGAFSQLFSTGTASLLNYDTIQGAGFITGDETQIQSQTVSDNIQNELTLVNRGTIDASFAGEILGLSPTSPIYNASGLLEATGGGYLGADAQVLGGAVSIGSNSQVAISSSKGVQIGFDNTLGDSGKLTLFNYTDDYISSPISGFYSDGRGGSDTIQFRNPDYVPDGVARLSNLKWSFHEYANGAYGQLTVSDAVTSLSVGSLLLAGHYAASGAILTSANSDLFNVVNNGFLIYVTTTATQSTT